MTIVHLMVPGLARRHLTGILAHGALQERPPGRCVDLVVSFPATIANAQATQLTGRGARSRGSIAHTVLSPGPAELAGRPGAIEVREDLVVSTAHGPIHVLLTDLARALEGAGPHSADERGALLGLDAQILAALAITPNLVVTGGPAFQPVTEVVALAPHWSGRARLEGALAYFGRKLDAAARAEILGLRGVERLLEGAALESWSAPADVGCIALAEPGWTFVPARAAAGHREIFSSADVPVLLAWGPSAAARWPLAVHDHRVGPTLAAAGGTTAVDCDDEALPW